MTVIDDRRPIAVFDSGVGGISVLANLIRLAPGESYLYFGDSANAPYGNRSEEEVRALTEAHVEKMIARGTKAVVIACNTATGAAIAHLRRRFSGIPIIGIEPAVKPAAEAFPGGRILVLATPGTVQGEKFAHLLDTYRDRADIVPIPCPQLARLIEEGHTDDKTVEAYLCELLAPHLQVPADAVVLGCTHYPLAAEAIRRVTGGARLFDGGEGTAKETVRQLSAHRLLSLEKEPGSVTIEMSGASDTHVRLAESLLARSLT